jgi:hypothetical protein
VFGQDTELTFQVARPTLTGFSPASGPPTTKVAIDGSNFSRLTRVFFGGAARVEAAPVRVLSPTRIEVAVPDTAPSGALRVENDVQEAISATSFVVTEAPAITSVLPNHAPAGTFVTVEGANFTGASVRLGTVPVDDLHIASDTRLTFLIPAAATSGPLRVTSSGATTTASFTVGFPVPTIASFAPQTGHGGQTLTVNGTGFFGSPSVRFGAVPAVVTSVERTRIRVTIPLSVPDSSNITVRTQGGSATSAQVFQTDL